MIGTITDITEQKQVEELLINNREVLEKRVNERTADLQEANVNLQRSNKKLEEFVYAASHDLQEPLRKLVTYAGMLSTQEKENFSEAGRQTLGKIINAVDRMQLLIKDLSDLSETSRGENAFAIVDLDLLLREVITELMCEHPGNPVEFKTDKLPVIRAVPIQMKQLLENLISNALKFSAHANPQLVMVKSRIFYTGASPFNGFAANSSYLELTISDNGIGFDQQYEDKIFQLFQRLHNRNDYPGTGIGLAICRNIAENHNGFIRAEGKKGQGASFHVFLKID
jgi:light-regulated signal transduction histidine kinase (bacteriophytochrome)